MSGGGKVLEAEPLSLVPNTCYTRVIRIHYNQNSVFRQPVRPYDYPTRLLTGVFAFA